MTEDFTKALEQYKAENPLPEPGGGKATWKELRKRPQFWDDLLDAIAGGDSVMNFARGHNIKPSLLTAWIHRFPDSSEQAQQYAGARRARAEYMADRIITTCDQVQVGDITPPQGRVIIDALRWMAARLDPHIWGEKLNIKAEITQTTELHLIAIREMAEKVKGGGQVPESDDDAEPIDGEFVDPEELLS